jgi:hypothetical protein
VTSDLHDVMEELVWLKILAAVTRRLVKITASHYCSVSIAPAHGVNDRADVQPPIYTQGLDGARRGFVFAYLGEPTAFQAAQPRRSTLRVVTLPWG